MLNAGCSVVFTTAPELNAVYALDQVTMNEIGSVARDVASGLGLPFGAGDFSYPSMDGALKRFNAVQIQALYQKLRDYTALLTYYGSGRVPDPPIQPVTIP